MLSKAFADLIASVGNLTVPRGDNFSYTEGLGGVCTGRSAEQRALLAEEHFAGASDCATQLRLRVNRGTGKALGLERCAERRMTLTAG